MWLDAHAASDCEELPAITMKQSELRPICPLVKAHKYLVILVLFLFSDFNKNSKYFREKTTLGLSKVIQGGGV